MTLRELIPQDFRSTVLSTDDFAETITYIKGSGSPRQIAADVRRNPPAVLVDQVIAGQITVTVANDPVYGIASDEIDTGQDRVRLSEREGGKEREYSIGNLTHDFSKCTIEVR